MQPKKMQPSTEGQFSFSSFTLTFRDPAVSELYRNEQFRALFPVHFGICATVSLVAVIAYLVPQLGVSLAVTAELLTTVLSALFVRTFFHFSMSPSRAYQLNHHIFAGMRGLSCVVELAPWGAHLVLPSTPSPISSLAHAPRATVIVYSAAVTLYPMVLHLVPAQFATRIVLLTMHAVARLLDAPTGADALACFICILAGEALGHCLEHSMMVAHERLQENLALNANSRRADSRLNHVLKNKSAEARYLIEEVTDGLCAIKQAVRVGQPHKVFVSPLLDNLAKVQFILEQTVEWTQLRELFLQLQHGSYRSSTPPSDVGLLLRRVLGTDPTHVKYEISGREILHFDAPILRLIFEEAKTNALKYKGPNSRLAARASLEQASAYSAVELHVTLDNENRQDVRALTPEECKAVFEVSRKGDDAMVDNVGDGLGLDNVATAAKAAGGMAWLTTYVDPEMQRVHTVFHVKLPARIPEASDIAALKALNKTAAKVPLIRPQGKPEGSNAGRSATSDTSSEDKLALKIGNRIPYCLGLDDSETLQMLLESVFSKMGADAQSHALGSTVAEQEQFVDLALGTNGGRVADIVVLDQNLSLPGVPRPNGTEVARKLHHGGYLGMIAIHSGLAQHELIKVKSLPFIDLVVSKGYSATRLANDLVDGFVAKIDSGKMPPPPPLMRPMKMARGNPSCSATSGGNHTARGGGSEVSFDDNASYAASAISEDDRSEPQRLPMARPKLSLPHDAAIERPGRLEEGEEDADETMDLSERNEDDTIVGDAISEHLGDATEAEEIPNHMPNEPTQTSPVPGVEESSLPLASLPEIDLSHLDGFSDTQLQRIIGPFYDANSPRCGSRMLDVLAREVKEGNAVGELAHRLQGDATTSGAAGFAANVREFKDYPTLERITALRKVLAATAARLRADGLIKG